MENLFVECCDCGAKFEFNVAEQKFYNSKGYVYPKRCKSCRDKVIIQKLGYKKSSILDKWNVYGIGAGVEGGLDIVHYYLIKFKYFDQIRYLKKQEEKKLFFVKNEKRANLFDKYNTQKLVSALSRNNKISEIIAIPHSRYENRSIGAYKKQ